MTNLLTSTTFPSSDPDAKMNMGTANDVVDYTFGGNYRPNVIVINLIAGYDLGEFQRIKQKLLRIFALFMPICTELIFNLQGLNEATIYLRGWRPANPDYLINNWLLTNSTPPVSPNPNQFILHSARVTNRKYWITPKV